MIGQTILKEEISKWVYNNSVPRFIIVCGLRGSESNLVAKFISDEMNASYIELPDVKVDTIRKMISSAYSYKQGTYVFNIIDGDKMSVNARNAMLKVVEEPPYNIYFVMTVSDASKVIDTLMSRARLLYMDPYMRNDLEDYSRDKYNINLPKNAVCETPGDVDLLIKYGVDKFTKYVNHVAENITNVSGAEALSMLKDVSVKDGDDKYDLQLFLHSMQKSFIDRSMFNASYETSRFIGNLSISGINKQMLLDDWCMSIRKAERK